MLLPSLTALQSTVERRTEEGGAGAAAVAGLQHGGECAAVARGPAIAARSERGGAEEGGAGEAAVAGLEHGGERAAIARDYRRGSCDDAGTRWCWGCGGAGLQRAGEVLPSLAALQSRLGLSDAELKKVVLRLPAVLGFSVEANVLPSLAALQSRLGLSEAELKKVVLLQPAVLSLSVEANVLPKVAFFQRDLGLTDEEVRERVVSCPAMLSYSLEGRLRPRWELCQSMGLPPSMLFSFHSKTPEAFEEVCTRARARER